MKVETEKEDDGRWIAEIPTLPGAMAYGATKKEAVAKVETADEAEPKDETNDKKQS